MGINFMTSTDTVHYGHNVQSIRYQSKKERAIFKNVPLKIYFLTLTN